MLDLDPSSQEAKAGINNAKSQAEAAELLAQAKEAAINENYSEAYDICHKVLRLHQDHEEAMELLAVVEMVKDSKVATSAQNWPDAILLMEKAMESYPDSEVLQTGLNRARLRARGPDQPGVRVRAAQGKPVWGCPHGAGARSPPTACMPRMRRM